MSEAFSPTIQGNGANGFAQFSFRFVDAGTNNSRVVSYTASALDVDSTQETIQFRGASSFTRESDSVVTANVDAQNSNIDFRGGGPSVSPTSRDNTRYIVSAGYTDVTGFVYRAGVDGTSERQTSLLFENINFRDARTTVLPAAQNDTVSTSQNRAVTIDPLANDTRGSGTTTISSFQSSTNSGATITEGSDGRLTYTPLNGFGGTDSFTYTIQDGQGNKSTATVTVKIDNDRDGVVNDIDIDDDNDGILDVNEGYAPVAQTGTWTINGSSATMNLGNGVVVRATGSGLGAFANTAFNANGNGFWSSDLSGDPGLSTTFDSSNDSITFRFEDTAGNLIAVRNPVLHVDRIGSIDRALLGLGSDTQRSQTLTLQNGLTWSRIAGTDDFAFSANTAFDRGAGSSAADNWVRDSTLADANGTAAGSLRLNGAISTFTLTGSGSIEDALGFILEARPVARDSDGGGLPDYLDLDSDNDGITDNVEAQTTAGYKAPSGMGGTAAFRDANGDGLDDNYGPNGLTPVDTDRDGTADYIDTDSDNDGRLDIDEAGHAGVRAGQDSDGDGLDDAFDAVAGYDVNDADIVGDNGGADGEYTRFSLPDTDRDTNANEAVPNRPGNDAMAGVRDLDFREDDLDNDGIPNAADIDDDNDGIIDTREGGNIVGQTGTWTLNGTSAVFDLGNGVRIRATATGTDPFANEKFNPDGNGFWDTALSGNTGLSTAFTNGDAITFTFIDANGNPVQVDNPILNIDRIGSLSGSTQQSQILTLQDGLTWTRIAGTKDFGATVNQVKDTGMGQPAAQNWSGESTLNNPDGTAAGSLRLNGRVSSFVLRSSGVGGLSDEIRFIVQAPLPARDTDGDGRPDYQDLDSDNDGITDNVEAQATKDYKAPSETGPGGGFIDTNRDGLDDNYGPNGLTPVDTDGDGRADYIDTDSDNDGRLDINEAGHANTTLSGQDSDYDGLDNTFDTVAGFDVNDDDIVGDNGGPDGDYTRFALPDTDQDTNANEAVANRTTNDAVPLAADLNFRDNQTPAAAADTASTPEDTTLTRTAANGLLANDTRANSQDLSITSFTVSGITTAVSSASPGTANIAGVGALTIRADGSYTFTPAANYNGSVPLVSYTARASNGITSAMLAITVDPVNDAPMAVDDTETTDEDTPVTIDVLDNDTDVEGDNLSVTQIAGQDIATGETVTVTNGQVTLNADGTLTFTPNANYNGPASFDYTVSDGDLSDTGTVTVTVTPVNDAPMAVDDNNRVTDEDTPIDIDVLANDTDVEGDMLSVIQVAGRDIAVGETVTVANGQVTLNANGTLTFTPADNYNGPATFDYTVSDGDLTDTGTVNITVTPVNDAPMAVDDNNRVTDEDTPIDIDVLANDTDVEGDMLSVTQVAGQDIAVGETVTVANGQVTLNVNGTLTFTPADNYNGPASFDYTVSDGGLSDTGTVNVTVTPVNDAPVTTDDTATTDEDTPVTIDVLDNDTDVEGDMLSVTQVAGQDIAVGETVTVTSGQVTLNADGTLTFTPNRNYNGPASFDYTVSDGDLTDTGTVNITVTPVNDAPMAVDDTETTDEDTPVTIDVLDNDTDVEGDNLSVTQIAGQNIAAGETVTVANGQVTLNANGTLTFTPADNYNGPASFDYTVSDGDLSDTGTVNVTVTPVNDAPVATDDTATTDEDTPIDIDVLANDTDVDNDNLIVTQVAGQDIAVDETVTVANGQVTLNADGTLTFTPADNYNGPASFDYTVSDGDLTDTGTVTVTVTPVNDAPVAVDDNNQTTAEDTPVTIDVLDNDTDVEGDNLSVTQIAGQDIATGETVTVTNGQVTLNADGTLTFTPAANYNGPVSFDYTVSDGELTDTGTVNVTVTPVNDAPMAVDDNNRVTDEDAPIDIDVVANDIDVEGDNLSVTQIAGQDIATGETVTVTNGQVTLNANGTLTFTPADNYNGAVAFDYTVSDGDLTDTGTVNITVTPVNDAPTAVDDNNQTTAEDTPVTIDVLDNDTDVEGDNLTVTQVAGQDIAVGETVTVTNGRVTLNANGTLTFTPAANYNGPATFDYTVSDGNLTDTGTVNVTVAPVNDAPMAVDDTETTTEDTPIDIDVLANDTDVDNDNLTVTQVAGQDIAVDETVEVTNGQVTLNANGTLTFTPADNYNGLAAFDYTVSDGDLTDTGTVNITVTPVNDAPMAVDDTEITDEDTPVTIDVLDNDTDVEGDMLSVTQVAGQDIAVGETVTVTNGRVALNDDGTLTFTPNANYNGPATFDYTVSDGNLTDTGTVSITVTPVNDAPVATDDTATTDEDTPITIDVLDNDTDVDNDDLTITQVAGQDIAIDETVEVTNGQVTLNANGTLTFTPDANYNGPASFGYTVSDGDLSDTGTVTVTVTPVNDAPVAVDDTETTAEDTPIDIDVVANDTDVEGDMLSV